jgi:hypothetical protein
MVALTSGMGLRCNAQKAYNQRPFAVPIFALAFGQRLKFAFRRSSLLVSFVFSTVNTGRHSRHGGRRSGSDKEKSGKHEHRTRIW